MGIGDLIEGAVRGVFVRGGGKCFLGGFIHFLG